MSETLHTGRLWIVCKHVLDGAPVKHRVEYQNDPELEPHMRMGELTCGTEHTVDDVLLMDQSHLPMLHPS